MEMIHQNTKSDTKHTKKILQYMQIETFSWSCTGKK